MPGKMPSINALSSFQKACPKLVKALRTGFKNRNSIHRAVSPFENLLSDPLTSLNLIG